MSGSVPVSYLCVAWSLKTYCYSENKIPTPSVPLVIKQFERFHLKSINHFVVLCLLSSWTGNRSEGFRELAGFTMSCLWFIFNQNLDGKHCFWAQTTSTQLKIMVQKAVLNQSLGTGGYIFASFQNNYLLLVVFGLNALYLAAGMQIRFSLAQAFFSPWNVLR